MIKILFVCHGNICRSPMAEFIMKDLVKKANRDKEFLIESAATSREELGNPVYPPVRKLLNEHGVDCSQKHAREISKQDYEQYDYLIGMDEYNLHNMQRICGEDVSHKMHLLLDYTDHKGDVADPWYSGDFDKTWKEVSEGCKGLLATIK